MEKLVLEQTKRIKSLIEQIMDDDYNDENEGETRAQFAGTWVAVDLGEKIYHVLVSGDSREKSIAMILDGEFNKLPYEEWDEIEEIADNFLTQNYGSF